MPANPTLPTSITAGVTTGHVADSITFHGIFNGIYKAVIGTQRTGNFSLAQSDSGEVIRISSASSVAVTVGVLEAGTSVELVRMGAGGVTLSASGTTIRVPTGSTAAPRVQYSSITLLYLTTTEVLVGGDLS